MSEGVMSVLAAISNDDRLTLRAKGIANVIGLAQLDQSTNAEALANKSREGMEATRGAIRELKRYGYVAMDRPRGEGGRLGSPLYTLVLPEAQHSVPAAVQGGRGSRHGTAGWVYAITSDSHVKIGRSYSPQKRLSSLQSGSTVPLRLIWTSEGGAALELFLHERFADRRVHSEWFNFSGVDAVECILAAVAEFGGRS